MQVYIQLVRLPQVQQASLVIGVTELAVAFSFYSSFILGVNDHLLLTWFLHIVLTGCGLFNHIGVRCIFISAVFLASNFLKT